MDYLRSKIVEKSDMVDEKAMEADEEKEDHSANAAEEDEEEEDEEEQEEKEEEEEEEEDDESPVQNTDSAYESGDKTSSQKSTTPAAQNTVSVIKHEV